MTRNPRCVVLVIIAAAALAMQINISSAQPSSPTAGVRHESRRPMLSSNSARRRPNRSTRKPTGRFSDARPITPTDGQRALTNGGDRVKSGGGPSVWKTFGALALIVGLIVIGGRLWKKHGPAMSRGLSAEAVEVLGKRSLDTRQSIHLVRIGSRILVLGSTAAGLRTLAEVVDPMEVDYLAGLCQRRDADNDANQSFRALFGGRTVVDTAGEASTSVQAAESRSFSQHRRSTTDAAAHEPVLPGRPHA